jgi:xanthine/uracil permease
LLGVVGRKLAPLAWPWTDFAKVAGACAVMAIVVNFMPAVGGLAELVMKAIVGAAAYVMAALVLDAAGARMALQGFAARKLRRA